MKSSAKQNVDRFIHQLFPGASSLLMNATEQECHCEGECSGGCNKLGNILPNSLDSSSTGLPEIILGMISRHSELLLFERSVVFSLAAEVWLLKVEY